MTFYVKGEDSQRRNDPPFWILCVHREDMLVVDIYLDLASRLMLFHRSESEVALRKLDPPHAYDVGVDHISQREGHGGLVSEVFEVHGIKGETAFEDAA